MLVHWALPSLRRLLPEDVVDGLREAQVDSFYEYPPSDSLAVYYSMTEELLPASPFLRLSATRKAGYKLV